MADESAGWIRRRLFCGLNAGWVPDAALSRLAPRGGVARRAGGESVLLTVVRSSRLRVVLGSAVVATSTAWLVGGAVALRRLAGGLLHALPWAVTIAGVGLLLRAAVPKGRLAGPLLLVTSGIVGVLVETGMLRWSELLEMVPLVTALGGVLLMVSGNGEPTREAEPVHRLRSWIVPVSYGTTQVTPVKLILRCVFGEITVDLAEAKFPLGEEAVTVDVTMLGGRIDIAVPHDWHVRAGRVDLARRFTFLGPVSDERPPVSGEPPARMIVLNVQGFWGTLEVNQMPPPLRPVRPRRPAKGARKDGPP